MGRIRRFERGVRRLAAVGGLLLAGCVGHGPEPSTAEREPHSAGHPYEVEIAGVAATDDVRRAMDLIVSMEEQLLADLIELTEIPAPPFGEEARAIRFASMLREAGLDDVTIDEVGNVIGRRAGKTGARVIALSAHLDTVFPIETDVTVRVEGNRYHAPGIGDNTRGLVVLLAVLRALQEVGIETDADVLFIGNVGEEGLGDLRGVRHLFRDGAPPIDTLIAIDGGGANRIVYGGVGSIRYRVTLRGSGGHSWGAFGCANPHHALGNAVSRFVGRAWPITSSGDKSTFSIGRIGGGTSINSIPFESWMEVDMRSGSPAKLDALDLAFRESVSEAVRAESAVAESGCDQLDADMRRVGTRPASQGNAESPVVQRAMAAMQTFGMEPELQISSTDANIPLSLGIPAVTLSRGGISKDVHAPTEYWENVDGEIAIHIALLTLLAEAQISE